MCAYQLNPKPDTAPAFAVAYSYWRQVHIRYHTLRRLSDIMASRTTRQTPPLHNPELSARLCVLETAIDQTESILEGAALQVAQAPDTGTWNIAAVLHVLHDDLHVRHQIAPHDTTFHLVRSARQTFLSKG